MRPSQRILQRPLLVVTSIGNPEPQYSHTRHSIGHEVINLLNSNKWLPFRNCVISRESNDLLYLKSQGYMNHSGPDVVPAWKAIKSKYSNVHFLVLYDEMGKGVGKYQLRYGNVSSRGHNGLKSLVNSYGNEFYRLGIGIDRPKSRDPNAVADYVLSRTKPEEWATVKRDVVPQVMEIIDKLRKGQ